MPPSPDPHRFLQALPAPLRDTLAEVGRLAAARGWPVYVVGGLVRDIGLGLAADDCDLVVEGPAPVLAKAAAEAWGGAVVAHARFGTATWQTSAGPVIDFATARTETYPQPAALPLVHFPASIQIDLARRDFAVNAIAVRLDGAHFGEVVDPQAGLADLAARVIRVLHPQSFQDDPTRLFRAVRYEQRLGFQLTAETKALIPGAWAALAALSPDRLRHEFERVFAEVRASAMLERLDRLEVLARAHPALRWGAAEATEAEHIARLPLADWRLPAEGVATASYLALLLRAAAPAEAESALRRLNAPGWLLAAVQEAVGLRPRWTRPSEAVAVLEPISDPGLAAAYVAWPELRRDLGRYLSEWRWVRAGVSGADLIARGLKPGPHFRELLWAARAAWLDGEVTDAPGEAQWLARWLARHPELA